MLHVASQNFGNFQIKVYIKLPELEAHTAIKAGTLHEFSNRQAQPINMFLNPKKGNQRVGCLIGVT